MMRKFLRRKKIDDSKHISASTSSLDSIDAINNKNAKSKTKGKVQVEESEPQVFLGNLSVDDESTECDSEDQYLAKNKELNSALRKYRRRSRKLDRRAKEIHQMNLEIQELRLMTKRCDLQMGALDEEARNARLERRSIHNISSPDIDIEVKRKEPMYFKKYNNLKNRNEAKNLLGMVRQRQRALQHLETMVYRKYLEFKGAQMAKAEPDQIQNAAVPVAGFSEMFESIRAQLERRNPDSPNINNSQNVDIECVPYPVKLRKNFTSR